MTLLPCAILLAGGKSNRFGSNKAAAKIDGQTLTAHCAADLLEIFEQVIVVTKSPSELGLQQSDRLQVILDGEPDHAAIIGLRCGLEHSDQAINYITGCDMPGIVPELIRALYSIVKSHDCALRCDAKDRTQPLGGFYSKSALPEIKEQIANRDLRLSALIRALNSAELPFSRLIQLDPHLVSFQNINTPSDLR